MQRRQIPAGGETAGPLARHGVRPDHDGRLARTIPRGALPTTAASLGPPLPKV